MYNAQCVQYRIDTKLKSTTFERRIITCKRKTIIGMLLVHRNENVTNVVYR